MLARDLRRQQPLRQIEGQLIFGIEAIGPSGTAVLEKIGEIIGAIAGWRSEIMKMRSNFAGLAQRVGQGQQLHMRHEIDLVERKHHTKRRGFQALEDRPRVVIEAGRAASTSTTVISASVAPRPRSPPPWRGRVDAAARRCPACR